MQTKSSSSSSSSELRNDLPKNADFEIIVAGESIDLFNKNTTQKIK